MASNGVVENAVRNDASRTDPGYARPVETDRLQACVDRSMSSVGTIRAAPVVCRVDGISLIDDVLTAWPQTRAARPMRVSLRRTRRAVLQAPSVDQSEPSVELGFRSAAVQVGLLARLGLDRRRARRPRARRGCAAPLAAGRSDAGRCSRQHRRDGRSVARVARDSPRPRVARSLVRRLDRVRRVARRQRRLELRAAALPRGPVHRGRADRLAPRLLARRQRGDVCGCRRADPAVGRRDGDAACSRRRRRSGWRSSSCGRSAARRRRTSVRQRAPSSSGRSRRRRITGSRTTCRRLPTCSCSVVRTAETGRRSTTRRRASGRSPRCTDC